MEVGGKKCIRRWNGRTKILRGKEGETLHRRGKKTHTHTQKKYIVGTHACTTMG